jgi:hypothetical protein
MSKPRDPVDSFDPAHVKMMENAIERAWSVIRYDEHGNDAEARSLLSLCVLNEARSGEENPIKLVNRAILRFRQHRVRLLAEHQRNYRGSKRLA